MSEKYSRLSIRSSALTIVISIALVLTLLGITSLVVLKAKSVSDYVKENITVTVFLDETAKDADIIALQKSIDASPYRRATVYVSKEEAAKKLQEDLGEDFIKTLGFNPLQPSIEISLRAAYANNDSIAWIEKELREDTQVKDVYYQKSMVSAMNENINQITIGILIFSGLLLLISIGLINNTIRLAIYSKRFLIRTMNLVGATQGFIRRPFVLSGIRNGIFGAIVAIALISGIIYGLDHVPDFHFIGITDLKTLAILYGLVTVLGIFIAWICTALAVRKYLRQDIDSLYKN
ncbi:MAG: cell division protein [Bacteroidetes bacterium]|nr:MAG: cell division protein [Bacteroidota bacterium]